MEGSFISERFIANILNWQKLSEILTPLQSVGFLPFTSHGQDFIHWVCPLPLSLFRYFTNHFLLFVLGVFFSSFRLSAPYILLTISKTYSMVVLIISSLPFKLMLALIKLNCGDHFRMKFSKPHPFFKKKS